jgi:imidazolonepropionase-like amidohydrolase
MTRQSHVVQAGSLRRIGNPPSQGVLAPTSRRVTNPLQIANLHYMAILLTLAAATLQAADNDTFLIRNADVYPVTSTMKPAASVLVENGKITQVGSKVTAPKNVRVIEGKGLRVYPGLIDSSTQLGLSEISGVRETVDISELGMFMPQLRTIVAVNPESEHFPVVRANGITSAMTFPSSNNGNRPGSPDRQIIAGQAALIHLDGWTWEDMEVKRSAAIQMIFPTIQRPGRGGETFTQAKRNYDRQLDQISDFFDEARRYQRAKAAARPDFQTNLTYEAMLPVLEGKLSVAVSAFRERTVRDAIAFADKQKIRIVLLAPREIAKVAADIKARNIPVILGPTLDVPLNEDDPYDSAFTLPSDLYKAGIKFAFGTFENEFVRDLPYSAAVAVNFGLPYDEALKAITINAAEIWGAADRIGSIDVGKVADLMVTNGDPLETPTQVKHLFIRGREVDLTNKQTRLYEKYSNRP